MRKLFQRRGGADWILACLGNVGDRYEGTRHNTGFAVADVIGERENLPIKKIKFHALTDVFEEDGKRVLLLKPVTYMNLSGEAVGEAARFYHIPPERVLVVSDDVALPVGKIRVRAGGSAGGHNGLKSVIEHLGTQEFPRVRVGVGAKPSPEWDMADWVLGRFDAADREKMAEACERAADAALCVIREGVPAAMNRYN